MAFSPVEPAGGAGSSARRRPGGRLLLRPGDAPAVGADLPGHDRAGVRRLEEPAAGALLAVLPGLVLVLVLLFVVGGLDRRERRARTERDRGDRRDPPESGRA